MGKTGGSPQAATTHNHTPTDITSTTTVPARHLVGLISGVPRVGFPSLCHAVFVAAPGWRPSFGRPFGATLRGRLAVFPTPCF